MISNPARYPFSERDPMAGSAGRLPFLPLTLALRGREVAESGLVDSGATINVMPYDVGLRLGAFWEDLTTPVQLGGNLATTEARALVVTGTIGPFKPTRLAFAWTRSDANPLILGQVNFFLEFDACFFRSRCVFEVKPKQVDPG